VISNVDAESDAAMTQGALPPEATFTGALLSQWESMNILLDGLLGSRCE
jgi:hypothetical protein